MNFEIKLLGFVSTKVAKPTGLIAYGYVQYHLIVALAKPTKATERFAYPIYHFLPFADLCEGTLPSEKHNLESVTIIIIFNPFFTFVK